MEKTYEDLLQEIEAFKQGADLAKRDAESMRARIQLLNQSYFSANDKVKKIESTCDMMEREYQNVREIFPSWFEPENVLRDKINLYELQIQVLKNRVKELEN